MRALCLRDHAELRDRAAAWFCAKWEIPADAYGESIDEAIRNPEGLIQWYVVLDSMDNIVAGSGIIHNDFHDRVDLTPNLCALYVEEVYRGQGLARTLPDHSRNELHKRGVDTLHLVTDHTEFYEHCGWSFMCLATGDDGEPLRLYKS